MSSDIFISYSSKDESILKRICEELKNNSLSYWISMENDSYGQSYAAAIIDAISDSKVFLVFMSENSNTSTHVVNEINSAVMRDKMIIPVKLDDVELSGIMEYYLSSNHWITYKEEEFSLFIDRLVHRLLSIINPERPDVSAKTKNLQLNNTLVEKAEKGDVDAQYQLANSYYKGINGLPHDLKESVRWYISASQKEHAAAQNNLAWCYEVGDGVEQDFEKSFYWYERSANNGNEMAQYSLGWMYENGVFVSKNRAKAFEWHNRAAERGHDIAQYKIGLAYEEGALVEQSDVLANHWFTLAADQNNVMAMYKLAENTFLGKGCRKDIIKAKNMWLLSADRGYVKSFESLEKYYDIFYNDNKTTFNVE